MTTPSTKVCSLCTIDKPIGEFYREKSAKDGYQSRCKACEKARCRDSRKRNYTPEQKARWQRKTRYGMTQADYDTRIEQQGHACALCSTTLADARPHVDHCHNTGAVRGILCMSCNLKIGGWDDMTWRARALEYLGIKTHD